MLSELLKIYSVKTNNILTISKGFLVYASKVGKMFADAIQKANKHLFWRICNLRTM